MQAAPTVGYTLRLDEPELAELQGLLAQAVSDIHAEIRRTDASGFREELVRQESVLRDLAEKVRKLRA